MRLTYLLLSTILILSSCQGPKLEFDRIQFYTGNPSLPPPYQEHYRVKLDTSNGVVSRQKGQDQSSSGFSVNKKDWKKIVRYAQKLTPDSTDLGRQQVGAGMHSIELFQGDSSIYSLMWQEHQSVSKAHKKIERKLRSLAPAVGVDLHPQDPYQEAGE